MARLIRTPISRIRYRVGSPPVSDSIHYHNRPTLIWGVIVNYFSTTARTAFLRRRPFQSGRLSCCQVAFCSVEPRAPFQTTSLRQARALHELETE